MGRDSVNTFFGRESWLIKKAIANEPLLVIAALAFFDGYWRRCLLLPSSPQWGSLASF